jgi:hypothetical protein
VDWWDGERRVGTPKLVGGWISGLVEWEETRGSGKVKISGLVDKWTGGRGETNNSGLVGGWASGQGRGKGQAAMGGVKIFLRCGENVIRTRDYVSRIQKFHFAR